MKKMKVFNIIIGVLIIIVGICIIVASLKEDTDENVQSPDPSVSGFDTDINTLPEIIVPENYEITGSSVVSVTYSLTGDEYGGYYSVEMKYSDDMKSTVARIEDQETHSSKTEITEKTIENGNLAELEAMIDAFGMREWNDLPMSEIFVLDAATFSVTITLRDGREIHFSESDELPENGRMYLRAVVEYMEKCAGRQD